MIFLILYFRFNMFAIELMIFSFFSANAYLFVKRMWLCFSRSNILSTQLFSSQRCHVIRRATSTAGWLIHSEVTCAQWRTQKLMAYLIRKSIHFSNEKDLPFNEIQIDLHTQPIATRKRPAPVMSKIPAVECHCTSAKPIAGGGSEGFDRMDSNLTVFGSCTSLGWWWTTETIGGAISSAIIG